MPETPMPEHRMLGFIDTVHIMYPHLDQHLSDYTQAVIETVLGYADASGKEIMKLFPEDQVFAQGGGKALVMFHDEMMFDMVTKGPLWVVGR